MSRFKFLRPCSGGGCGCGGGGCPVPVGGAGAASTPPVAPAVASAVLGGLVVGGAGVEGLARCTFETLARLLAMPACFPLFATLHQFEQHFPIFYDIFAEEHTWQWVLPFNYEGVVLLKVSIPRCRGAVQYCLRAPHRRRLRAVHLQSQSRPTKAARACDDRADMHHASSNTVPR